MNTRKDVSMIMAGSLRGYIRIAYQNLGIETYIPYKDYNIFLRILRELWFKLHLPLKSAWFNKQILNISTPKICIRDPLIIPDFLKWVCDNFSRKQVILIYSNRIARSTIKPIDVLKSNLKYVSYDENDCKEYNIQFSHAKYFSFYKFDSEDKKTPIYDVIYLGRDKGRAKKLFAIQKKFESMGLKTYFHVCADRSFMMFTHKYYKPEMEYTEYIELLKRTKSHLNIVPEGQRSITQRELESIFNQVKCITNNRGILDFELYDPSRFFVLGVDELQQLPKFLKTEFVPISISMLEKYDDRCDYL